MYAGRGLPVVGYDTKRGGGNGASSGMGLMSEFLDRYFWVCVTAGFASLKVASLHWISRFSFPAMLSTILRSSTSNLNSPGLSLFRSPTSSNSVVKSIRPVGAQSCFTTPWGLVCGFGFFQFSIFLTTYGNPKIAAMVTTIKANVIRRSQPSSQSFSVLRPERIDATRSASSGFFEAAGGRKGIDQKSGP